MNIGAGYSNFNGSDYNAIITDTYQTNITGINFDAYMGAKGHRIKWKGEEEPYAAVKRSSCSVTFLVEDGADEATLLTPFTTPEKDYYMIIIGGESNLIWWGYVTPDAPRIKGQGYPKEITIEAVDILSLAREESIWGKEQNFVTWYKTEFETTVRVGGTLRHEDDDLARTTKRKVRTSGQVPLPEYGFGYYYRDVSNTPIVNIPNNNPTVVELIFSLLFQRDLDTTRQLRVVEYYDFNNITNRLSGGLGNTALNILPYIYSNYPNHSPNPEINDISTYELISHICELFNARIFQWEGEYWVVQNECYQYDKQSSQGSNVYNWFTYQENTSTGFIREPLDLANGTYSNTSIRTTVYGTGQNRPRITNQSFEKDKQLHKVEMNHTEGSYQSNGISDMVTYLNTSSAVTSGSGRKKEVESIPSAGKLLYYRYGVLVWNASPGFTSNIERQNPTALSFEDIHSACVLARFEARSEVNDVMECDLISNGTYEPQNAITYDSKDWIWTELMWDGEMDEWKGRWVEMNASDTNSPGYGEIKTEAVK